MNNFDRSFPAESARNKYLILRKSIAIEATITAVCALFFSLFFGLLAWEAMAINPILAAFVFLAEIVLSAFFLASTIDAVRMWKFYFKKKGARK